VTVVLDASAVLALLYREPGHEQVATCLDGAVISAVNWSEVRQKLAQHGAKPALADILIALGADVLPFTADAAVVAAGFWPVTRSRGLSLADRACLAVARGAVDGVAVTADAAWVGLDLGVPVRLIR